MRLKRKLKGYRRVSAAEEAAILDRWDRERQEIRGAALSLLPHGPWGPKYPLPISAADWHRLRAVEQRDKDSDALDELHIEPYKRWGLKRAYVVYVGRFIADSLRIVQVEQV